MSNLPASVIGMSIADEPQSEMDKRREMIKTAVDAAASGVMENIKALRAQLDDLENLVIQNAARVSEHLNAHVGICEGAQIEISRLSGIVAEMRQTQVDSISERSAASMADDHPFYEVAAAAQQQMLDGFTIHQKFTCARCGSRQTISEPNKFFTKGLCEECGKETNIVITGCNYVAMIDIEGDLS